jgi:hypothetical protein
MGKWVPAVSAMVLRIGGLARLEPDCDRHLERIRRTSTPEEFAEWMAGYRRGDWVLVRLDVFADVATQDGVMRCDGECVQGLSFGVPHGQDNLDHAAEMVLTDLDALARILDAHGVRTGADALADLDVSVELDSALERRLLQP